MNDTLVRAMSKDGMVKATAVYTRALTERARQIHHTSPVATAALGRALAGVSMMGNALKGSGESVTLQIKGDGPLGTILAVSDAEGNVRGYVDHPEIELPLKPNGKIDVGGGVGNQGHLAVIRDTGEGKPYVGQVELVSGEIAEDLTSYYASSEQIPTVCALGVLVDKEGGEALLAGGLLIQALPGADDAALGQLEQNVAKMDSVTTMLAKGMSPEDMCRTALEGFEVEILDEFQVHYACTCSKERFSQALLTLGSKELWKLYEDERDDVETVCHYCNKRYSFSKDEIKQLAMKASEMGKKKS